MLRHRSSRTSVAEEVELPTYANGFYDICHPLFIGSMAAAILSRTLRQFSPDTLVIRRVHRQHHQNESAARSRVSRTAGGHTPRDVSLLSSSDVQQIRLVPPSSHTNTNTNNNADDLDSLRSGGGARRTRSADVQEPRRVLQPLSVGKPRSQSDDRLQRRPTSSRSTSRGLTLQGLSSSRMHSSSSVPNTTTNNNSGRSINASFTSDVSAPIVPPLKLGKPPLSGGRSLPPPAPLVVPDSARSERMRSTPRRDGDAHHRHRSSSSRPESLRSTPRGASRGADGRSSQQQQQQQHRSSERVGIFSRIMKANISRGVGLASHLLRAAPAVVLHACSSVKRQLIALPLMRFKDLSKQPRLMLALILPWANVVGGRAFPEEDEWKLLVEDEPYAMHLLISRAVLYVVGTYMKEAFFLDTSVVVRNLRSRNYIRHVLGWSLRVTSHVVFDPLCISLITPLICVSAEARQNPSGAAGVVVDDGGGGGGVGQLRWSWAGMLRASAVATAAVLVESVVCPIAVHLVDRAIITVMENVEYVMMRRYTILFSSSEEDETDDDVDDDDGTASRAASVVSAAVRRRARARRSGAHQRMTKEERQEQRDAAGRRAVMRAIVFRVAASLVAHCVVNHPMRVLVELLRGRAVLHATGLLAVYDDVGGDGLTWAALQQLWLRTTSASSPVAWMKMMAQWMGEEVNTIYSSICHASGQEEAIHALRELHMRDGAQPSAQESAQLLRRSLASLAPLYGGLAFTAMDKILSFYMSVWVRLTRS